MDVCFWGLIGLAMVCPVLFGIALIRKKAVGTWWAFLLWAAAMYGSMIAYGILGIDYEDNGKPFPLWLITGFTVGQVGLVLALGGLGWRLWQLWRSSRRRKP